MEVNYQASPTLSKFHKDNSFVRGIMGPIGSGKSVACTAEILRRSMEQEPNSQGLRQVRAAIIRNTYRELVDTTIRTFFDWIPRDHGTFRQTDMQWSLRQKLPDGTTLDLEILFRALDKPDDIRKLLSLELTFAWINEAREVPKQVLDMLQGRVGRFPSRRDKGPTWFGIIMDTNPPDNDHWWYKLFEDHDPPIPNFKLFKQPSGTSPHAENISNLPSHYYQNMILGKDHEWINVYVHGRYGFLSDGKPIFPEYDDNLHTTLDPITPLTHITVGIDFGLTPAAAFIQQTPSGQVQIIDELCTFDMGAVNFALELKRKIKQQYPSHTTFQFYGDPAGEQRSQVDERTPFQILTAQGINATPAYTNDFTIRREVVASLMHKLALNHQPAFLIGPKARMIRKAFAGGYKYKRVQVSGEERYQDKPDKNRYSHPAEAVQYAFLGLLGDDSVIGGYSNRRIDYSHFNRKVV